jgi:hypothetical protein
MKVYLAGERSGAEAKVERQGEERWDSPIWLTHVKRRLFSYFYHNKNNKPSEDILASHKLGLDLFLDSGAFSAFSKGALININDFSEFVKKTQTMWTTCSSLDHIGQGEESAIGSKKNFDWLRNTGAKIQPVFHVREPDKYLEQYMAEGWDYIFIGGMVPETTVWLKDRLDGLWDKVLADKEGRPKVKTHGFGLTDQKLMFRYPWYSVDSTSWLMTGIFGGCLLVTPDKRVLKIMFSKDSPTRKKINGWHFSTLKAVEKDEIRELMEPYNITPEQCAEHYSFRDTINAAMFQQMEILGAEIFVREHQTLF